MNWLLEWAYFHRITYLVAAPAAMLLHRKLLPGFRAETGILNRLFAGSCLLMLASELPAAYDVVAAWYAQTSFEQYAFIGSSPDDISQAEAELYAQFNRMLGPYWWAYWSVIGAYVVSQLFWLPRLQYSRVVTSVCCVLLTVNLFSPLIRSFLPQTDYLPSSWFMLSYEQLFILPLAGLFLLEAWALRQLLQKL
ncbi:hypothetical protein [Hymenobacter sp. 102]|uniref:hypothetical protein n=1 Tax=Hymenobacter sp. 102 TaxID=3403152 RepID=UPI003CF5C84B